MKMKMKIGQKYLITTSEWFYAPDGQQYRAIFGTVHSIETDEQTLGVKTNRGSTNWYVLIGEMIVAGCQIHYVVRADEVSDDPCRREIDHDGETKVVGAETRIYRADKE